MRKVPRSTSSAPGAARLTEHGLALVTINNYNFSEWKTSPEDRHLYVEGRGGWAQGEAAFGRGLDARSGEDAPHTGKAGRERQEQETRAGVLSP